MLIATRGIVLRSVKYGETSLVTTIFTHSSGVQAYLVQGVRSTKAKNSRAGMLQTASLLDLVVYQKPQANLQRIKELQQHYIYTELREDIVKNSIAVFSAEVLLRLLPEQAPQQELFDFAAEYLKLLDKVRAPEAANFPLFFLIRSSAILGYRAGGRYADSTPYLDLQAGGFAAQPPVQGPYISRPAAEALDGLLKLNDPELLGRISMNGDMRAELLDWYLLFLKQHTQHMGQVKSLGVLQTVLHG